VCKRWCNRISFAVKWKRRRFPQHIKQQHDDALTNGINKQRQ
jgi:hypothetical protein